MTNVLDEILNLPEFPLSIDECKLLKGIFDDRENMSFEEFKQAISQEIETNEQLASAKAKKELIFAYLVAWEKLAESVSAWTKQIESLLKETNYSLIENLAAIFSSLLPENRNKLEALNLKLNTAIKINTTTETTCILIALNTAIGMKYENLEIKGNFLEISKKIKIAMDPFTHNPELLELAKKFVEVIKLKDAFTYRLYFTVPIKDYPAQLQKLIRDLQDEKETGVMFSPTPWSPGLSKKTDTDSLANSKRDEEEEAFTKTSKSDDEELVFAKTLASQELLNLIEQFESVLDKNYFSFLPTQTLASQSSKLSAEPRSRTPYLPSAVQTTLSYLNPYSYTSLWKKPQVQEPLLAFPEEDKKQTVVDKLSTGLSN